MKIGSRKGRNFLMGTHEIKFRPVLKKPYDFF